MLRSDFIEIILGEVRLRVRNKCPGGRGGGLGKRIRAYHEEKKLVGKWLEDLY
jgi:hypothetical protein